MSPPALVALETAVLTHGLPRPLNVQTALRLEAVVREEGGEPRTVGVVDGRPVCGLSEDEIRRLGEGEGAVKVSIRDLPVVMARGLSGGTTVAATLHVAGQHGVRVFATGGIGGVHRALGGRLPTDVSADLDALARYPVCTVCAGAKAILDLPATMEALETRGVTVLGLGTDTLPAFYSRGSRLPVDARVGSPEEAAAVVRARAEAGLPGGVLLCVPVPPEAEVPGGEIEPLIHQAVEEAERQGLRSAEVTPFLLSRVAALTGERALRANLALLEQNARVAARVARALSQTPSPMNTVNTITEDLKIEGMTCRHCVDAVQGALGNVDGVTVTEVGIGHARVNYPSRAVTSDQLARAVEEAGYTVRSSNQVN